MSYIVHIHTQSNSIFFFIFVVTTKKWHKISKHCSNRNYGHVARTKQKSAWNHEKHKVQEHIIKETVCVYMYIILLLLYAI